MTDLVILGTDTDAGKTTFALLWLAAFASKYEYWKPVETGEADSERVRQLVPSAVVHAPMARFRDPVAPLLAARRENRSVPPAATIAAAKPFPRGDRSLLIESFGSALSPLDETALQIELIRRLAMPTVLITPSAVGAVGRTLQTLRALAGLAIHPSSVVLLGSPDVFAIEQIMHHAPGVRAFTVRPPDSWDCEGILRAAREQGEVLKSIRARLAELPTQKMDVGDLLERDRRSVWHPYTSLREADAPLIGVAAHDEFIELADGRQVIDAISSWWTILHGHRYPPLMAKLAQAAQSIDHVHFAGVTHSYAVALAELLLSTAPWNDGRVFYSDNGSTAVEVALKMAYQYWCHHGEPRRSLFIGFEGGYHGDTFGAMAVGRDPVFFGRFEPLLFRAEIVPLSAERLDDALSRHRGEVAAVIVEPLVQGAGGMRMHSPAELRALYQVTCAHGVLFIADEVMTGGGRTGSLWAHQAAGIAPDLICAAKTLTGGVLPLAATLVSPTLVAAWDTADRSRTFFHGHSFTAHPLACAVAQANWQLLTAAPIPAPRRMELAWNHLLEPLRRHSKVREARILGTIAAVEIDSAGGYLADVGRHMRTTCLEHGVVVRPLGPVLYAIPPFCTSEASLERIAHAMTQAICSLS
jgi:adenosylmethionine-8-amino-7-oxononanoate aminotransferase